MKCVNAPQRIKHVKFCFMTRQEGGALLLKCPEVQEEKLGHKSTEVTTVETIPPTPDTLVHLT